MDLESAVRAALRGELGIIMKTREEAEAIVDVCREFGALTEYLPIYEVPNRLKTKPISSGAFDALIFFSPRLISPA